MGLVIAILWLASIVFGWLHHLWWLVVTPIVMTIFAFGRSAAIVGRMRDRGLGGETFVREMTGPNIILVLWNTVIACVLFGGGWLVATLLGR